MLHPLKVVSNEPIEFSILFQEIFTIVLGNIEEGNCVKT